ncbi:MAG: helix-turn-helix domain-containing protein [Terriglobales bacterium]
MESFGARLKREREARKISLDDIAISTKIGTRFLLALEEDHFDQLPGGIFNKGFVRAYARHVGLDEAQTISDFESACAPSLPEVEPVEAPELAAMAVRVPQTVRNNRKDDGIPWGLFAIVLLVLAFGLALWGFYSREKSPSPGVSPTPVRSDPAEAAPKAEAGAAAKSASPETTSAGTQPLAPEPTPSGRDAAPSTALPAESAAHAGVFNINILIKARQDSWVAITADGKPVVEETLAASGEKSIEARNQVVIKTGNVGALDISFNGKKLAPQGENNEVKTLTFDQAGLRH